MRSRWLTRKWKTARNGNPYLKTPEYFATIFPDSRTPGRWKACVSLTPNGEPVYSTDFANIEQAKLAAFDLLISLTNS